MMKIKSEKGKVVFVMRTGKTFVRNTMPLSSAQSIVNRSKNVEETPVMNPQKQEESTPTSNQTYYIVKKYGDVISVFFITEDGTQVKLEDTEIVYEVLPPEDQANFDKGIVVEEQEDLNTLLQDFEG